MTRGRPTLDLDVYKRGVKFFGWRYTRPPRFSIGRARQDTRRALEILLPRPERVWRDEKLEEWDNAVTKRNVTIYGAQMTGKGHTARWLAARIMQRYDRPSYALRHPDDLAGLLASLSPDADVQIVFAEDLTSALKVLSKKRRDTLARDWFRIRHRFRDATGKQYGLIVAILGMHRFHGAPPAFTTENDLIIFKGVPTNPYDRNVVRGFIGDDGVSFLEDVERERVNDPAFLGYGVWWHRGECGVWYNPQYEGPDPFNLLEDQEVEIEVEAKMVETSEGWTAEPAGSWTDPDFLNEIVEELPGLSPQHAGRNREMFRLSLTETYERIAAQFGVTPTRVGQIVRQIKESELGYAAERAYHKRHPNWEYQGGNTAAPDFIDHRDRRVISFKAYIDPELREGSRWITRRVGEAEKRYAEEHSYTLEMHVYELTRRTFYTFKLHKKKQKPPKPDFPTPPKPPASRPGQSPERGERRRGGVGKESRRDG